MSYKNILVIKVRAMGDTLLATPTLRALKTNFPEASITAVVAPQGKDILIHNPDISDILVYDKAETGFWDYLKFIKLLRQKKYDLVIALHASFRTALMARLSGVTDRIIHNHSGRNYFATIPIGAKKEAKSTIERDLDVIRALGKQADGQQLTLTLSEEDRITVGHLLTNRGLSIDQPFMILAPGAGKSRKRWTAEAAGLFLKTMLLHYTLPWIVLAGPQEQDMVQKIQKIVPENVYIFEGSIKKAATLIKAAQGMVTADSGPKHVACAVGTPTLTLWTDEPEAEWHPYDRNKHQILNSPTGVVADITPEEVVAQTAKHFQLKK